MTNKVRAAIEKYDMLKNGSTVIIGLSGGADSTALADILLSLKDEFSLNLIAAHINHGIRGEEADRDEKFVENYCLKNNLPLKLLHADVPNEAKKTGESEEECGRRLRYAFFNSISDKATIATAHNLNDSVETFLINVTRGTGTKGLLGIPPKRDNIIRPLIECTRAEIEQYCKEKNLSFVSDSTNLSNEYTRNKIRHTVIPVLNEINPSFPEAMKRLFDILNDDNNALDNLSQELINKALTEKGYSAEVLNASPEAVKKRAVSFLINKHTGNFPEKKHIDLVCSILKTEGAVEITKGSFAFVKNSVLFFGNKQSEIEKWLKKIEDFNSYIVSPYGEYRIKQIAIKDLQNVQKPLLENAIDCDKIKGTVVLSSRLEGDKLSMHGRGNSKTLKKLFNEQKIPIENRNKIAVLHDDDGVLWVEGFGTDERAALTDKTKNIIIICGGNEK